MEPYVDVADNVWQKIQEVKHKREYKRMDDEAKLMYFHKNHQVFARSFPLILRFMVQEEMYNPKVFDNYLIDLRTNPVASADDYCKKQATYIRNLYAAYGDLRADIWQSTYDILLGEIETFERTDCLL